MNPVKQEDLYGCGVACVAFVLRKDYQKALDLFSEGKQKAETTGFYCKEIIKVLENEGFKYEYRYIKSKIIRKIYKQGSVVFLRRSRKYPEGHYLCRVGKLWMDSWINFPSDEVRAGFRKRLPERPIYVIYPN